jgi:two-component system OmpR family sensor kinase
MAPSSAPSAPSWVVGMTNLRRYAAVPTAPGTPVYSQFVAVEKRAAAQELVTVLAHDPRNHLTPLQGRLDLVRRRALREGRGEYLHDSEQAARSVDRLRRLIDDLLDVSRLQRGLFFIDVRPIDAAALVRDTAEGFAVGHSPPGDLVRVEVSETIRDEDVWIEIRVADDGPGVPPALLPRLFECFATGPGSAGLRLGLYLARRIAAAHGGTLSVDAEVDQGACFVLAWTANPAPGSESPI